MSEQTESVYKAWTIALASLEPGFPGGVTGAVIITNEGGGSARFNSPKWIRWDNPNVRSMQLKFETWPEEGGGMAEPAWPFDQYSGGSDPNPQQGTVTIAPQDSFNGKIVVDPIEIKYTVSALDQTGNVDGTVIPLDPIIVVER